MRLTPPILCLVTSRARLAARLKRDADDAAVFDALVGQAAAAAAGGVTLVQLREPDLPGRRQVDLARALLAAIRSHGTRLVVNDRLDVALAAAASGVHLKAVSFPAADVRALAGASCLIGQSVHAAAELPDLSAPDYLLFGTIFQTASKSPDWPLAGLQGLRAAVEAAAGTPVLGIGGISAENAAQVAGAGAAGLAAIDAFLPDAAGDFAGSVHDKTRRLRLAFDSPPPVSYHGRNG